jgi:hypothetical protein
VPPGKRPFARWHTKVFHKSFHAECDDGSVWKGVLIELMRGPNCPDGVWQRMRDVDTLTLTVTLTLTSCQKLLSQKLLSQKL